MKLKLLTQITTILFLVGSSGTYATHSTSLMGTCVVYLKGKKVLSEPFDLDASYSNPDEMTMDINVPDCTKTYTKFTAKMKVEKSGAATITYFAVETGGKSVSSSYLYGVRAGTSYTFYSKLLDDSFVTCSGSIQ